MKVLVTGANGLIGSAIVGRLVAAGHEVVAAVRVRDSSSRRLPAHRIEAIDMARATRPELWIPHLRGVDAVVNCAGVLQDSPRDSTQAVHQDGPAALITACEQAGVRRFVQISALGADRADGTRFSETKQAGDAALAASTLDWVILRPSVVLGRAAYGGSALIRALAALPILPRQPKAGQLAVIQLDDVTRTVEFFLAAAAPARLTLELCGPERLSFEEVIAAYRRWLGWPPARLIGLPAWALAAPFRVGDWLSMLGWRPPIRTTAQVEIERGSVGDPEPWIAAVGQRPLSLGQALAREPASVQERWFARLYLLKPLVLVVLSGFWIATGLISLGPAYAAGEAIMSDAGAGPLAGLATVAGGLADLAIGVAIAFRRTNGLGLVAALGLSVVYLIVATALVPELWLDPLGPLVKILPVIGLNLFALAVREDR